MSREKVFKVVPLDFEGQDIEVIGLEAALKAVFDNYGGKEQTANTVRPALSVGGGMAIVATEQGRVMVVRDLDATRREDARRRAEMHEDGRRRKFAATIYVSRYVGHDNAVEEVSSKRVVVEGLLNVFFETAMFVQGLLGDVPDCLQLLEVEKREAGIRAAVSRGKAQDREVAVVNFPGSKTAPWFEVPTQPGGRFYVSVAIETEEPKNEETGVALALPTLPKRG